MKKFILSLGIIILVQILIPICAYSQDPCVTDIVTEKLFEQDTVLRNNARLSYARLLESERNNLGRNIPLNDRIIPVVFHIVDQCGAEQVEDQQIINALEDVNEDFFALNAELDRYKYEIDTLKFSPSAINLKFKLATIDPFGNPTKGITRTQHYSTYNGTNLEQDLKGLIQWPRNKYLNVYVVKSVGPESSAYAQFPTTVNSDHMRDGIVINHSYLGTTGTATNQYRRRHILTHEIGHWAGLRHCWGETNSPKDPANCSFDDDINDTALTIGDEKIVYPRDTIMYGYPYEGVDKYYGQDDGKLTFEDLPSTCGDTLERDNIFNFMDYGCEIMFTAGQKARMENVLNDSIARRNEIGLLSDRHNFFLPDNPLYTTLTSDGVLFVENDDNNGVFLSEGIGIELSSGQFNFTSITSNSNLITVLNLPTNTTLLINRDPIYHNKAIVYLEGNATQHKSVNNKIIQINFAQSAFINTFYPLYNGNLTLRFETRFWNDLDTYTIYDVSYNAPNVANSINPSEHYAAFLVPRTGYLAIEHFVTDSTNTAPSGFYLDNESARTVEALCYNDGGPTNRLAFLPYSFNINDNPPSNLVYKEVVKTPRSGNALQIIPDNQQFQNDTTINIGLRYTNDCTLEQYFGFIRLTITQDGNYIRVVDGVDNFDTSEDLKIMNPECMPFVLNTHFLYIDSLSILDSNNTGLVNGTFSNGVNGYSDFSNLFLDSSNTIVMSKNEAYQVSIIQGNPTSTQSDAFFAIWIDYNDDGFFGLSEKIYEDNWTINSNSLPPFVLPSDAPSGTHKMRVSISIHPASVGQQGINPCEELYGGEFEDYTIFIYDECDEYMEYSSYIPIDTTKVSESITASGTVLDNQQIYFQAGAEVLLLPGFETETTTTGKFLANIESCVQGSKKPNSTQLDISQNILNTVEIFPNPARDFIELTINNSIGKKLTINVYDLTSNVVKMKLCNTVAENTSVRMDIANLNSGMYIIRVDDGHQIYSTKFLKL